MIKEIMNFTNTMFGVPLMVVLIFSGLYFSLSTGFFQITNLRKIWKNTVGKLIKKGINMTKDPSFNTIASVLGGTIGAGNIAGIASAIAVGGPGAIFWMWVTAFLSMSTKMVEVMLATKYQKTDVKGNNYGGPMYYIKAIGGKAAKVLAIIYTITLLIYSMCNSGFVQVNTIATSIMDTFDVPAWSIAIFLAIPSLFVISGGLKRVSKTLRKLVPIMSFVYILSALFIIFINIGMVPIAIAEIFKYAFKPAPIAGGFIGSSVLMAITKGAARGVAANEAGLGTSSTVHATTKNDPVTQGCWGVVEVSIVSFIVCTLTALLVLTTDAWTMVSDGGAPMVLYAYETIFGQVGKYIMCFVVFTFCYSTYIGFFYEYTSGLRFLFNEKWKRILKWTYIIPTVIAVFLPIDVIWNLFCDTAVGLIAIPNILALFLLRNEIKNIFNKGKVVLR